ncbi:hypothetical protein [Eubacterium oxidoreducens]|uniref:Uncharacterized protein n=1 Tax=Eubacterium oxidoreducens TaxID=1732 RepID=A0A1G6BR53_EUBOX|nr:hypothetical protein [Eubacterium oxidoreducens]SDB23120.1 hypothetical protein SAMN02910417_01711 [Eubacterium oxidoreducens]
MELNEKELRSLIERVIELTVDAIKNQDNKVLVVYSGNDKKRCVRTLRTLRAEGVGEITLVATQEQLDCENFVKEVCTICKRIVTPQSIQEEPFIYDKMIFPVMPRSVLAKCALGISDIYETEMVKMAFEEGIEITIARGGLDKFTGNEPLEYQQRIMGYIRTLVEYGIHIQFDTEGR